MTPTADLALTYRLLHLIGMAIMLGGAVALIAACRVSARRSVDTLALAVAYERLFWPVLAVQVLTGVGNIGMYGKNVPGPATAWADALGWKLLVVGLVAFASLPRTLAVIGLSASPDEELGPAGRARLGRMYGVSAALLTAIVYLAAKLAHG